MVKDRKSKRASIDRASKKAEPVADELALEVDRVGGDAPDLPEADVQELESTRLGGETIRIITGSYEHNLLSVALTLNPKGEIFTPIFHFTPHTQSIRCLARTKRFLVSGANDELIRLYDLQRRRELGTLMHHSGQVLVLQFYHSKWLLSGAGDGKICIWRVKDWELLAELKAHKAAVVDLAIHESGRIAISVGEDRTLVLWNLMTARKATAQRLPAVPRKVVWVPGTNNYVIGYERKIAFYESSKPAFEIPLPSALQEVRFHAIGEVLYLIASYSNGKIVLFDWAAISDAEERKPVHELHGHSVRVKDFAFLDKYMASVSSDGKIVVWDLNSRTQLAVYSSGDRLNCVLLVPDEVEKYVKRSEVAASYGSDAESEAEAAPKSKKKKARVTITRG